MMKHAILAMAALLMLCVGALHAFDTGPRSVLVSPLESAVAANQAPRHSGVMRIEGSLDEIAPPDRFQSDNYAVALFGGPAAITALCGGVRADGRVPLACTSDHTMALPNPCVFAHADFYAAIVCHELGHANGWPQNHGD
jgi:hypothetical protein